jgi:EAL domain-containing protein (putative c-di-GMP-specific phosphodiesterase class I)
VGSVSPTVFIPIAEESELICPIGDWVLYKAINDFKTLVKKFNRPLYLSINLSAIQMKSPDLIQKIEKIIHHTDVEPHDLHLELTETSFLDESIQVVQNLDAIENLGIKIDIDDFGVGFASLKYLQKFPVSSIKIDRSFIQHLNFNSEHKKLVESIILLGKNLKKDIIAEGVENLEHLYMLYTQKCYKYQGYLFSKPVPLGKFERLLHEEQAYRNLKASMGKDPKMDKLLKTEFN